MGNNNTKNNNYKNNNIKIDFDETILDIESKNQFYNNYNYQILFDKFFPRLANSFDNSIHFSSVMFIDDSLI